ncbi:MAG: histidine phosphatase family protein [Blastocatellia bacterium]
MEYTGKICLFVLAFALSLLMFSISAEAQKKTFILVRHAEKSDEPESDPDLTDVGRERARRLSQIIGKFRPGAIYSTAFRRTRETAMPLAERRRLNIQTYDAKTPQDLVTAITKSEVKRFLIVGHSNTVPGLANLLIGKEIFKQLDEGEYGTIWVIRFKNGRFQKAEILHY